MRKTCKTCGLLKRISEFGVRNNSKDGYHYECRKCYKLRANNNYRKRQVGKQLSGKELQYVKEAETKTKLCSRCKKYLPFNKFSKSINHRHGVNNTCYMCIEDYKRLTKDTRFKVSKNNNLKKLYGITLDDYEVMFYRQKCKCLVCGCIMPMFGKTTHVDHCHETNEVRGILCSQCNTIIGLCYEDSSILASAIDYIDDWKLEKQRLK